MEWPLWLIGLVSLGIGSEDGACLRELGFNSNGGIHPLELGLTLGARFEFEWYLCPWLDSLPSSQEEMSSYFFSPFHYLIIRKLYPFSFHHYYEFPSILECLSVPSEKLWWGLRRKNFTIFLPPCATSGRRQSWCRNKWLERCSIGGGVGLRRRGVIDVAKQPEPM